VRLTSDGRTDQSTDRATDQPTVGYIDTLKFENELLRRELEDWKEEARRKDHLLAAALERIPEIEAPSEPSDLPVNAPGGDGGTGGEPSDQERPSWWRRFFGF
jgi:hypothetical protein